MTKIEQIDNSLSNERQSWIYQSIWRTPRVDNGHQLWMPKQLRIEIRAGAYTDQSHASISEWSEDRGWLFFKAIPADEWYAKAPSYVTVKAKLTVEHLMTFSRLEESLIQTFMRATYGSTRDYELQYLPDA